MWQNHDQVWTDQHNIHLSLFLINSYLSQSLIKHNSSLSIGCENGLRWIPPKLMNEKMRILCGQNNPGNASHKTSITIYFQILTEYKLIFGKNSTCRCITIKMIMSLVMVATAYQHIVVWSK